MLLHLPDGYKPEQVRDALAAKIKTLPDSLRLSLTWDQGPEMRDWKHVSIDADIDIYFCDPHSPWQRGTNENTNGLLRQYFPRAPTWVCTAATTSSGWPRSSTIDPAND
jgi:IS30 family transposase